jgi:hypothetical protein
MSKRALTYVYLALGSVLALLIIWGNANRVEQREENRDISHRRAREQVVTEPDRDEWRSPKEAARYRAEQLTSQPLRTIGLFVVYVGVLGGAGFCLAFPDRVAEVAGPAAGDVSASAVSAMPVPESAATLLFPAGIGLGLLFAVVIHQSIKTAGDIRYGSLF